VAVSEVLNRLVNPRGGILSYIQPFRRKEFRVIEAENQDNPYLPSSTDVR
jgi:hypothetical protein